MEWSEKFKEFEEKISVSGKVKFKLDGLQFDSLEEMLDWTYYGANPTDTIYVNSGMRAFGKMVNTYRSISDIFLTYKYYFPRKRSFRIFLDKLFVWLEKNDKSLFYCGNINKINIGEFSNYHENIKIFSYYIGTHGYINKSHCGLSLADLIEYYKKNKK